MISESTFTLNPMSSVVILGPTCARMLTLISVMSTVKPSMYSWHLCTDSSQFTWFRIQGLSLGTSLFCGYFLFLLFFHFTSDPGQVPTAKGGETCMKTSGNHSKYASAYWLADDESITNSQVSTKFLPVCVCTTVFCNYMNAISKMYMKC